MIFRGNNFIVAVAIYISDPEMYLALVLTVALCVSYSHAEEISSENSTVPSTVESTNTPTNSSEPIGCVCAIFLSGQFKKGSKEQPKGYPALLHEHPDIVPCNAIGNKLCTSKCLDAVSF